MLFKEARINTCLKLRVTTGLCNACCCCSDRKPWDYVSLFFQYCCLYLW